jgi:hypothetical protein
MLVYCIFSVLNSHNFVVTYLLGKNISKETGGGVWGVILLHLISTPALLLE